MEAGSRPSPLRPPPWVVPVVAALALGLLAALPGLAAPARYRADAKLVVAPGPGRSPERIVGLAHTAASLVRTRAVAQNVVASLQIHESADRFVRRIHVRVSSKSAVIVLGVDQPTKARAERAAQQTAIVFATIARARLGSADGRAVVTVWDSPTGSARRVGPHPLRDGSLGALAGLLLGSLVAGRLPRGRHHTRWAEEPAEAEPPTDLPVVPPPPPAPQPEPASEPEPQPEPQPESEPEPAALGGRWRVGDLERVAAAATGQEKAELDVYVRELRVFAAGDGTLPPSLDSLVEEVFAL